MSKPQRKGNLFIISGPSGAGKGTLVKELQSRVPDVWVSVSATTRQPRAGEVEGKSYYFRSTEEFKDLIKNEGLLEYSQHFSHYYGTPLEPVLAHIEDGKQVILEIDVEGALQVQKKAPYACLIFIEPPSVQELRRRLEERGTESPQQIEERISRVNKELALKTRYNHVIVNDNLNSACVELVSLIDTYAHRQ